LNPSFRTKKKNLQFNSIQSNPVAGMASQTPDFFFAPTWDYPPPPTGPIQLGNLITSLQKPEQPLFTAALPTESEIFSSDKHDATFSRERMRAGKFGILTQFLSVLGFGIDIEGGLEKRFVLCTPRWTMQLFFF
jgi:hypothetical protein